MSTLAQQIDTLGEDEAVAALKLVVERKGLPVDQLSLQRTDAQLGEALAQPELATLAAIPEHQPSRGELARTALAYLAEQDPDQAELIERALVLASSQPTGQREPITLAIGALAVLALRTDLKLEKQPEKGWSLRLHLRPLSDTTLSKLLGELIALYRPTQ